MPKYAQEQFTARPQVAPDTQQRYQTEVTAAPVNTFVTPAESNLARLSAALGGLAPVADKFFQEKQQEDNEQQEMLGFKASKSGEQAVSPTSTPWFRQGFIKGTWENNSIQASDAAWQEYQQRKDDPTFDLQGFLQQKMREDLNGVTSPVAIKAYMDRFGAMGASLQQDLVQHHTQQVMQQRHEDVNVALSDLVSRLANPDHPQKFQDAAQFMDAYKAQVDSASELSITRPEMAGKLLDTVTAQSKNLNGRTDLFDVFYQPQPGTGKSLVEMNPKLGEQVEAAKVKAQGLYDHYMTRENYSGNQQIMADITSKLQTDPESLTDDYLHSLTTTYGPFGIHGGYGHQYSSIIAQRDAAIQAKQDAKATASAIASGNGWQFKDSIVKQHLSTILAPDLQALAGSLNDPNAFAKDRDGKVSTTAGVALNNIVTAMTRTGTDVVPDQLSNLANSVKLMAPVNDKDATVPTKFTNLHNLYAALSSSSNSSLVDRVFDKDSKQVMESYDYLVKHEAVEPTTAWRKAFFYNSPEGLAYMQKKLETPEGTKLIQDAVNGSVSGIGSTDSGLFSSGSWFPNWARVKEHSILGIKLGNGSLPVNYDSMVVPATFEAKRIAMTHEGISNDELQAKLSQWAKANFIHDETTNRVVQVQEGKGGTPETARAFSDFSAGLQKKYGSDAQVGYLYMGNGHYAVEVSDGSGRLLRRDYPDITHQQVIDQYKFKTQLTDPEILQYNNLDTKARDGNLTLEDINGNKAVIDKARQSGLLSPSLTNQIGVLQKNAGKNVGLLVEELQKRGIHDSMMINPNVSAIPDLAAKKPVAQMMMQQGDLGGALTVMGEGVALKAYADPAKGTNIGIGYNIDANTKTAPEDFRKAGIQFSVDDIKNGKASITPEQAVRLYQVVQPRYESIARDSFDKRYKPGAYDSLSSPEKAVLTDIAYQAGGNVSKFTSLFNHMMTKDPNVNLADALALTYKDRTTGQQVIDEHRRNLRLSVLLGRFQGSLKHAGIIN